jgi:hypothetical protein
MKSISFLFFFLYSLSVFSADKEMVIIRVDYQVKKTGIESKLYCDIGNRNTHSLYRALTNSENTVQIKDENDKTLVFTTEVDLMNYLFTIGYHYESTYTNTIMGTTYTNFVLVKE